MTRAPFTGPVRSHTGFEVGKGDASLLVIDADGVVHTSAISTVAAASLGAVTAGTYRIFFTSTKGLVLKTSTGLVGTITVA